MGAWGPGLYSDDYALDLRATLAAVCRLPIDGPEIVKLLCDLEPASLSPEDEDYATFWLVVADQLHKRGIPSQAEERALAIIDDGSNLEVLEELGMSSADLRKRRRALERLREALTTTSPDKQRKTLKKPQSLVMERGQVYTFPVDSRGNCVNPYFTDATRPEFVQKGWGAFLVANTGHALGYLAWYQVVRTRGITKRRPSLDKAVAALDPAGRKIGTLTRLHAARMQLELLGSIEAARAAKPSPTDTIRITAADISIANALSLWATPGTHSWLRRW
jgi:hypothetical protein